MDQIFIQKSRRRKQNIKQRCNGFRKFSEPVRVILNNDRWWWSHYLLARFSNGDISLRICRPAMRHFVVMTMMNHFCKKPISTPRPCSKFVVAFVRLGGGGNHVSYHWPEILSFVGSLRLSGCFAEYKVHTHVSSYTNRSIGGVTDYSRHDNKNTFGARCSLNDT